jgi:AcrR family transcriptional regulator
MKSERRKRLHDAIREEIKEAAWQQITRDGAAALSLRAIAKQLDLTSPALYHYYPNRDALVNDLITDAFHLLATSVEQALTLLPQNDYVNRFLAIGNAYRNWANAYPQRYVLIFSVPIPNYQPSPEDIEGIQTEGNRALGILVHVIGEAWQEGKINLPAYYQDLTPLLRTRLEGWKQITGLDYPDQVLYLTLVAWCRIHGIVSLELRQQFPPIADAAEIFQLEAMAFLKQIGMGGPNSR